MLKPFLTIVERTGKSLDNNFAQLINLLSQEDEGESLDKVCEDQVQENFRVLFLVEKLQLGLITGEFTHKAKLTPTAHPQHSTTTPD